MNCYVCIDVGGTAIKHGVLDETAAILEKGSSPTPVGGPAILQAVMEIIERYCGRYTLAGAAISSTGVVDCDKGEIVYAGPTVPDFIGTNFKHAVESRFSLPCEVENDVNCAGLAEYVSGAGQGSKCMVCLTVGTGIGGCAIVDGKVLHGASHSAMEVGYLPVDGAEFQDIASAGALCADVARIKGDGLNWDGKRIFAAAREGDPVCLDAIDRLCGALARGIAAICYVLNPDALVLGGGIMNESDLLAPRLESALRSALRPMTRNALDLRFAAYGNDAGLIGALYHFLRRQ